MNRQTNKIKLILEINSKLSDVSPRTTKLFKTSTSEYFAK